MAENESVAFEMVEAGPPEPATFRSDVLMSEARAAGLSGDGSQSPNISPQPSTDLSPPPRASLPASAPLLL